MSKIALISVAILTASLTIGCATNSDIENLQSQIDDLNSKVSSAQSAATFGIWCCLHREYHISGRIS